MKASLYKRTKIQIFPFWFQLLSLKPGTSAAILQLLGAGAGMRAVAEADRDTRGVKLNQKMNQPESCTISESFALADNKVSSGPVRLDFICCEIMKFLVL